MRKQKGKFMVTFEFSSDYPSYESSHYKVKLSDDITLQQLFASFIDFVRVIGYYSSSWDKIIKDIADIPEVDNYDINDWAMDNRVD